MATDTECPNNGGRLRPSSWNLIRLRTFMSQTHDMGFVFRGTHFEKRSPLGEAVCVSGRSHCFLFPDAHGSLS